MSEICSNNSYFSNLLTERNVEYLVMAAFGFKNCETAEILDASESTVKKTLQLIYGKLKARDRTNAVNKAWKYGIINNSVLERMAAKYSIKY